jgi:hypothetical protein
MKTLIANGLPTTGEKAEAWNHPLLTGDWINKR